MHVQRFAQTWREMAEPKVAEQFMASCTELGSHSNRFEDPGRVSSRVATMEHCMHATVKQVRYLELVMTLEEQHGFQPRNP
jgi:hypothetical protein